LSCDITEKSAVNEPASICGTVADADPAGVLELELELQAASTAPSTRTAAAVVTILVGVLIDDSFRSDLRAERPLVGSF
jgi:hypothetical protein